MIPEMKERRTRTTVLWTALTTQQQARVTRELARLLYQYVQGNQPRSRVVAGKEGQDERPSQDS